MRIDRITQPEMRARGLRWTAFFLFLAVMLGSAPVARAAAGNNNLKIIAWYGAGNLSKSEYGRDTVILFNPTQAPVSMNGWSLQTGGTTGSFTTIYKLPNVTIPAGGFYAIAGSGVNYISSSGCSGANCNTNYAYDYQLKTLEGTATATDNDLSSTAVVAALVNTTTSLGTTCSLTSSALVDIVGIAAADGSSPVTCYAGGGAAPYTPATLNGSATSYHGVVYAYGTVRRNRCTDTFNNAADFALGYIQFQNSLSTPQPCPTGNELAVTAMATPDNPALNKTFTITAAVTSASAPASSGLSVTADLSNLGLSSDAQMYDDGTHGDVTAGDGTYTLTTAATSGSSEVLGVIVTATDTQGNMAISDVPFTVGGGNVPGPGNNNIEIIDWYGAGNLSKSQYGRDTVILFNPTQAAIAMNNWSLQTGGTTGSFTTVYKLPNVTIPAGGYYAIAGSGVNYISSSGCTSTTCNTNYAYDYQLKTLEGTVTNTDNDLASTAVTVALVNNQTALSSGCPQNSPHVVDIVGVAAYDGSATVNCWAGSNSAPYTPSSINGSTTNINGLVYPYATVRNNKCVNTFDNAKDFSLNYITFANSATTPQPCGTGTQLGLTASASPNQRGYTEQFTLSAPITFATNPSSFNVAVTADLSNLGLATNTPLYDDGTHGDAKAGDHIYTTTAAATSGEIGIVPGLIVTATDGNGNSASNSFPLTLLAGTITMTTPSASATVKAGGVATFPITITGQHGYGGTLSITCTGSPNSNSLNIPVGTECLPSPPEMTLTNNGSQTFSLAVATGLVTSASSAPTRGPLALAGLLSLAMLGFGLRHRKRLPAVLLAALVTIGALSASGCGKNAGLTNVTAAPGTYTYVITATDSSLSTITTTLNLTVTVQ